MKTIRYKQFISCLPVDTKTVIDYSFSMFKDIEKKDIYINKNKQKIKEIDKAYLSLFLAFLTINTDIKKYFYENAVDRDIVLEFLENYNDKLIFPIEMKPIYEDEKEKIFLEQFSFLEKLVETKNKITIEKLANYVFSNNDISKILDIFFKETYKDIENAREHKSIKGLRNNEEKVIELKNNSETSIASKKEIEIEKETTILDKYGISYNKKYDLHQAISREQEIRNIQIALMTPSKRSVVLVGPPGVGKRTIVESLAKNIKEETNIPDSFKDKKIIEIDISSIIAGTSFRGQFEERVKEILDEAKNNNNIILFINDIHKGINAGEEENRIDFVSMLNNYLSRGELSLIATTTKEAYENIILPNNISNKLWKITVDEPTIDVVEEILYSCIPEMSEITKVKFPNDENGRFMIKIIAQTTSKEKRGYFSSGNNPDLAKGILERTFAIASINNHKSVEKEDLIEAIETDESISKEAREKQANILRQTIPKIENNIIKLKLIK